MTDLIAISSPLLAVIGACLVPLVAECPIVDQLNRVLAMLVGLAAITTAVWAFAGHSFTSGIVQVDGLGAVFLLVCAVIGVASALVSPIYLAQQDPSQFAGAPRWYYLGFYLFWAALLAIPLSANLGVAWLLIEATTGASALLVAYSGKRRALEAAWKYLVLTTLGLTVALLGIVFLYAATGSRGDGLATLNWSSLYAAAAHLPHRAALVALVLIIAGLAAKTGWAPVHHWLPDAHSEAPAPVSALLSGALLPTVMLVAWRVQISIGSAAGMATSHHLFIAFGLVSLAVAVPFLWKPMAIKRLLAYSSLEHVGVLALGIGFAQPLALAGVVLHVWGHALAKSLGFYATIPLFRLQPSASHRPTVGVGKLSSAVGTALGVSFGSLSGLPPSPLFFSELFILLGGLAAGQYVVAAVALVLLALGFIGLSRQLIEGVLGRPRHGGEAPPTRSRLALLTAIAGAGLGGLSAAAYFLPGSGMLYSIARGVL